MRTNLDADVAMNDGNVADSFLTISELIGNKAITFCEAVTDPVLKYSLSSVFVHVVTA
jgi:hypothetical protein